MRLPTQRVQDSRFEPHNGQNRGATMKRLLPVIGVLGLLFVTSSAAAQSSPRTTEQSPPMTNLQVWPKDTPRAQVLQTMNAFNDSLGVECSYCHVAGDFASDAKREKQVARQMI